MDELFSNLESYIYGAASLDHFKDYFYELAYGIRRQRDGDFVARVHEIERIFAESSSANWNERTVRRVLNSFIRKYKYGNLNWNLTGSPQWVFALDVKPIILVPAPQVRVVVESI